MCKLVAADLWSIYASRFRCNFARVQHYKRQFNIFISEYCLHSCRCTQPSVTLDRIQLAALASRTNGNNSERIRVRVRFQNSPKLQLRRRRLHCRLQRRPIRIDLRMQTSTITMNIGMMTMTLVIVFIIILKRNALISLFIDATSKPTTTTTTSISAQSNIDNNNSSNSNNTSIQHHRQQRQQQTHAPTIHEIEDVRFFLYFFKNKITFKIIIASEKCNSNNCKQKQIESILFIYLLTKKN